MRNFWGLLWQSFQEINGLLLGLLGICISLLAWFISKDTKIGIIWLIIIVILVVILIWTLLNAINKLLNQNRQLELDLQTEKDDNKNLFSELETIKFPKITYTKKEENEQILCLLSKSSLFNINQFISVVYQDENGYESLIAVGEIINVQTDGNIQARIQSPSQLRSSRDIFDRLGNNESVIKERIIIKPNIDRTSLTYF